MMSKINEVGEMVLAQTNWRGSVPDSGKIPAYFKNLIVDWPDLFDVQYEYVSYGINFFDQGTGVADIADSDGPTNNWINDPDDAKSKYQEVALALCNEPYNAGYIALALEVNTYRDYTTELEYKCFVQDVYIPIYDVIKAAHPTAKVFVTFQLEQCKGLGDEWAITPNEHWNDLNFYNGKLDLIAFTTYPEFAHATPADIPEDYYSGIIDKLPANLKDKPLAFVEMGWSDKDGDGIMQSPEQILLFVYPAKCLHLIRNRRTYES